MAVIDVSEYMGDSPRLNGEVLNSKIVKNLGLSSVSVMPVNIITEDTFLYFLKHKSFSSPDITALTEAFRKMLSFAHTKRMSLRRAFVVPGLENPPGPYYLGIPTVEECFKSLEQLYTFAIKHNYHVKPGSRIEAFFYPFIDPPEIKLPATDETIFSRGGYAVPVDEKSEIVRILAVFGNNDGVQSLPGYDEYIIDTNEKVITKKTIPQKELALCTVNGVNEERVPLPLSKQFVQVLSDWDILSIALCVREGTRLAGRPQRIEFSWDGEKMFLNESANFEIQEEITGDIHKEGKTVLIDSSEDLKKITEEEDQIVVISHRLVQDRDYDTLNAVANIKHPLTVLYPGTTVTAHAMRVLIDAGHTAFVIGNQEFTDGIAVMITSTPGQVKVQKIEQDTKEKNIFDLIVAHHQASDVVGGKAYNLGRLMELGYRVPPGYVISTSVYNDPTFFESSEFSSFLTRLDANKLYAVRSSANVEDGSTNAFAGQFASVTRVPVSAVKEAIQTVWESASLPRIRELLADLHMPNAQMAVIVQEMIDPVISGVIFGGNIETKNPREVIIEIANGYAEAVVEGVAEVRKVVFDKVTRKKLFDNQTQRIEVAESTIQALFEMYMRLEENFSEMQDVEWAIDKKGELYLVQTRPFAL